MSLNNVSKFQLARNLATIAVLQVLHTARRKLDKVCSRMLRHTIAHALSQHHHVVFVDDFRVRHRLRYMYWYTNLVDPKIRVWRDHSACTEVYALAAEVAAEATLLTLESLNKAAERLTGALILQR